MSDSLPEPGRFTKEALTGNLAVATLANLLTKTLRFNTDFKTNDNAPNIDGSVQLLDERGIPVGRFEVQIRKLPPEAIENPKLTFELKLYSASLRSRTCPVLFIGVDTENRRAYWVQVNEVLYKMLFHDQSQKEATLVFPKDNVIDDTHTEYIVFWNSILERFNSLLQDFERDQSAFVEWRKGAKVGAGPTDDSYSFIHIFLDELNSLLDAQFLTVKKKVYPMAWKLGIAYSKFEEAELTYTLYPIAPNENNSQIKKVDSDSMKELLGKRLGITASYVENPIKSRPMGYAIQVLQPIISKVIESHLLEDGDKELAEESIFAFIDRFSKQAGLDIKDKYTTQEIEFAVFRYLPFWVIETVKFMVSVKRNGVTSESDCLYRHPYFDPEMLLPQVTQSEQEHIRASVLKKISSGEIPPFIRLGNDRVPLGNVANMISFLRSYGIQEVKRVWHREDPASRAGTIQWSGSFHSPELLERNVNWFFLQLPSLYQKIVSQNFPLIEDKLPLFGGADKAIVVLDIREEYKGPVEMPTVEIIGLKRKEKRDNVEVVFHRKRPSSITDQGLTRGEFEIDGVIHSVTSWTMRTIAFLNKDTPLLDFVYEELKDNIERYLATLKGYTEIFETAQKKSG